MERDIFRAREGKEKAEMGYYCENGTSPWTDGGPRPEKGGISLTKDPHDLLPEPKDERLEGLSIPQGPQVRLKFAEASPPPVSSWDRMRRP